MRSPVRRKMAVPFKLIFIVAFFALSAIVMWLWNELMPAITHVTTISYWQAAGLLILSRILFGGMPFGRGGRDRFRNGPPAHIREKLMNMTDEERAQFKEQWKERCRDMRGRR
ncbi:hypothetical protein KXQ82_11340 [Mucilaginibacter sp. HMF5004]|uniref:hypothetical protein n=1 Tax=Mucilaginibacter rivuli TaxID=2857527 RepID=UPI001C5F5C5E|nr:hypothetical protein [Mucilaginibacter rivuli]MBW4890317.1 hypothetical protein [Mucilaginibacter rivuli]